MKRILSKKNLSVHNNQQINEELRSIENLGLTNGNIFQKLLHPNASQKKLNIDPKKYNPKFSKPDYQTLSEQNLALKHEIKNDKQTILNMKFKITDYQKKIKFLEAIQQKYELATLNAPEQGQKQTVYTQILKKKIQELNQMYLKSEQKIKELKHLPNVNVFDESNVQKQYLLNQTIRLKSIITSLSSCQSQDGKFFDNKFLKLMKEQNEKLKATIRLFQNDKNLLKSRQILQQRQINQNKKKIDSLELKLKYKESEIQKLISENRNLLFKRVNQLKIEEQKKQNEEINKLKVSIEELRNENAQLENQKQILNSEYQKLKKNEKIIENMQNFEDKQKTELKQQNCKLRRCLQQIKAQLDLQRQNAKILQNENRKKRRQKKKNTITPKVQQLPVVRFEDIQLPLILIRQHLKINPIQLQDIFNEDQLSCAKLIEIFCDEPFNIDKGQSTKLARYLVEQNTSKKITYDQKLSRSKSICICSLKAALNKIEECYKVQNEDIWRCVMAKNKKLLPELQKLRDQTISKQEFLNILSKNIRQNFGQYVNLIILQCADPEVSDSQLMLKVNHILSTLILINNNGSIC